MTVGRHDPCPCGSGKKYNQCCMPRAEVISLQTVRETQTHRRLLNDLRRYLFSAEHDPEMEAALGRFSGSLDPVEDLPDAEVEAALDWIAFVYQSRVDGLIACQRMAAEAKGLQAADPATLRSWTAATPGFFRVTSVSPQAVHLNRLPDDRSFVVSASGSGLKVGELIETWLLPMTSGLFFGFARETMPPEAAGPLTHLLEVELALLRRQQLHATWDDLHRQCWPRLADAATLAVMHGDAVYQIQASPGSAVLDDTRGDALANPMWGAVAELLTAQLREEKLHPDQIGGAVRLCRDAAAALGPRGGKLASWAAGLYYLFQLHVCYDDITQAEAGEPFGVTGATVGSRARAVAAPLGLVSSDPRYMDLMDPFVRSFWRFDAIQTMEEHPEEHQRPQQRVNAPDQVKQAEELLDEAWEAAGAHRTRLARRALALWPEAADAYVILGSDALAGGKLKAARQLFTEGVWAGERALGPETFASDAGDFWGTIEARPYMRARQGLAASLWDLGEREAAIAHYQAVLRLNPGDNQGVRYSLAARLLEMGDDVRLGQLLREHPDDGMAAILYTRAVWQYRQTGAGGEADGLLDQALKQNPHVPACLLGEQALPPQTPEYIGWGDESEAAAYVLDFGVGWRETPGALAWLRAQSRRLAPPSS